jgi:hypothetical protein
MDPTSRTSGRGRKEANKGTKETERIHKGREIEKEASLPSSSQGGNGNCFARCRVSNRWKEENRVSTGKCTARLNRRNKHAYTHHDNGRNLAAGRVQELHNGQVNAGLQVDKVGLVVDVAAVSWALVSEEAENRGEGRNQQAKTEEYAL